MVKNSWYVVTGGPSTGKTTLLDVLRRWGHKTFPETARVLIENARDKGIPVSKLREDEKKFQMDVLRRKVKLEESHNPHMLTFFDRGMHDTVAYLRLHGKKIEQEVKDTLAQATYKRVFLMQPLGKYAKDYARTESEEESLRLNALLYDIYAAEGMEPVSVPAMEPEERARFVLQHVDEDTKLKSK